MVDYVLHFTVHIYAEETIVDDKYLDPNNPNGGIIGEEIIGPLRNINGKSICLKQVPERFSVRDLWKWIEEKIYSDVQSPYFESVLSFVEEYHILRKYLCFNGLRYSVEGANQDKPLSFYLDYMSFPMTEPIEIQLLVSGDAGEVFKDHGIRYYMPSKEQGQHNEPHVHVDIRHEESGTFSLLTGKQMQKEDKVKAKDAKIISTTILSHQKDWLKDWNEHTDGLNVDLNQAFSLINY